jgi:hypothetical protein
MKARHYFFYLSLACMLTAPTAPLFFEQWGSAIGVHFAFAILFCGLAAMLMPDVE